MKPGKSASRPPKPSAPRPEFVEVQADDSEQTAFAVAPVRPPVGDRGLMLATVVVLILIGFAVAKPWSGPGGETAQHVPAQRQPQASAPAQPATPGPTPDGAADLASPICLGAGAWRIATLETWQGQDVRVWRSIEPVAEASGPLDPTIPTAPAFGTVIRALGWCAPAYGPGRPVGPAEVETWTVTDGVARELELRQVLPEEGQTAIAALYVPVARCPLDASCAPSATREVSQPWTSGRFVFRYEDLGAGTTTWFAVEAMLSEPVPGSP